MCDSMSWHRTGSDVKAGWGMEWSLGLKFNGGGAGYEVKWGRCMEWGWK